MRRHYRPVPRLREGITLAECDGVHAMMDISDGVASDLTHILKASSVGARIHETLLPLSAPMLEVCRHYGWDSTSLALCGGEDYELLFTVPLSEYDKVKGLEGIHVIGHVTDASEGARLVTRDGAEIELKAQGWKAF